MDDRELPLSFHTEAFESSETEKENYCLLRAEILLSISDPGVRYLFRSSLTSPLLVRGPHYTHVYLLHAVYCQTLLASQLDFVTQFTRSFYTIRSQSIVSVNQASVFLSRPFLACALAGAQILDLVDSIVILSLFTSFGSWSRAISYA